MIASTMMAWTLMLLAWAALGVADAIPRELEVRAQECTGDFERAVLSGSYYKFYCNARGMQTAPGYWIYRCQDIENTRVPAVWTRFSGGTLQIFAACGGFMEDDRCWGRSGHHGHKDQGLVVCDMTARFGVDVYKRSHCRRVAAKSRCDWPAVPTPPTSVDVWYEV